MKLYSNPASPFARKCRIILHELDIKTEIVNVNARDDESLRKINPLKKIPALALDDGSVLFDSRVICEYLNHVGNGRFFPGMSIFSVHSGRWKALTLQALADGIMDAAVACRYEQVQPDEKRNLDFINRYRLTISASLDALEKIKFAETPTIGEIASGCALGYLDFRYPDIPWRALHPKLAAWYEGFSQFPSMQSTVPHT
ncbi:MAG: glutathione S-transferase [Alphaproteobacteria bacterium]|nr:glutathione S-transferase [Alphaproteobacteria bacterium]MBL7098025.1 glutathione S-transferase [Alphaproteobacteria bacterium]